MSTLRLLRTKRQRQFVVAYLAWVTVLFVLYWTEPYAVEERWVTFKWLAFGPMALYVLLSVSDLWWTGYDLYRAVRGWINRGA